MNPLELWAGPECTVNRVGDLVRDQLEETGFARRVDDLDRLAALGIRTIRFPLLWERMPHRLHDAHDWAWADTRIARMRELGMKCIAGLMHHGSGPLHTHLLDAGFASGLATHARAVARRYPHLDAYTPVNEPLTTARFSGLYGVWYPHRRDDASFVRALLNQIDAISRAMRAIRETRPDARLVQTDDLGFTRAVPRLEYQAAFENERRWLAFDLLCGRVDRRHRMWRYLRRHGAGEAELMALVDAPCPPDIVGINSYVTSERFLDDRLAHYPAHLHGGNRRHRYVDVESVRVHGPQVAIFETRMRETWARYRLPVALTEAHLGCTREEQMRWLLQAWEAAQQARAEGADVRAVTAWAAFGTFDWDSLVTRSDGRYEPGMWDVRSSPPRPTGLAHLARELAHGRTPDHPTLQGGGWWQRGIRHLYPTLGDAEVTPMQGRPLLISGATGTLGRAFARLCYMRGLPYRLTRRDELDIADPHSVDAAVNRWRPWAIVNASGFVNVDEAEHQPRHWRENVIGPAVLAQACARQGIRLVTFSSDLVFDGEKDAAYLEADAPCPLNAYGRSKAEAERRVLGLDASALVVRTAAFFGPWDAHNFVTLGLDALRRGDRWQAVSDQIVSRTYVRDLVMATLDLLVDGEAGIWHLANRGSVSWHGFAAMAATAAGLDPAGIEVVDSASIAQAARRPRQAALVSERGDVMPTLENALERYLVEISDDVLPEQEERSATDPDAIKLVA